MKIIEFYGLPGSGKSTITNKLIIELKNRGFHVVDANDYLKDCSGIHPLVDGFLNPNGRSYFFSAIKLLLRKGLLFRLDITKRIINVLSIFSYYNKSNADYCVMDQAILQGIISAFYDISISIDEFDILFRSLNDMKILSFYVHANPETACERIHVRNDFSHGRCDSIADPKQLINILKGQNQNFERANAAIQRYCNVEKIDALCTVESSFEKVKKAIYLKE